MQGNINYPQNRPVNAPPRRPTHYAPRRRKKRRRGCFLPALIILLCIAGVTAVVLHMKGSKSSKAEVTAPSDAASLVTQQPAQAGYELQTAPPYTVALDAGHGGIDIGAEGIINEVEMTEATVSALYALLDADPNYTPVLCREIGDGMSIGGRVEAATNAKASLLLSIHGNSDFSSDTYGFECFATPPGRTYYSQSLSFAHSVATQFSTAGAKMRGESGVRYAYYVGTDETGYEKEIAEESDTSVREDLSFGVLEKPYCPALLVEQCFVTNSSDVSSWGTSDGCKAAAQLYYNAICEYFGTVRQ